MKRPAGFTFIELMITVGISGILFAGGLAAYRGIGEKQNLKQAGISFQSNLRLIQGKATAGEKPSDCGGASFLGYQVSYQSETSYAVQPLCQDTDTTALITIVELADKVKFSNNFSITFYGLESEITGPGLINLTKDNINYYYQVAVEQSGVITGGLTE